MISSNKTVNKAHELLMNRRENLREKRQNLRYQIEEKYPEDMYGLKGLQIFENKSKEMDAEIELLSRYISGMYDLIEIIEGDKS